MLCDMLGGRISCIWFTYSQLLLCRSVLEYQCQASPFGKGAVGNEKGGEVLVLIVHSVPGIPNLLCQLEFITKFKRSGFPSRDGEEQ